METTRLRFSDKKRKKAGVHVLPAGKFFILPISLFLLLFASCGKDDAAVEPNGPAIGGGDIKFEIGFAPQGGAAFMNADLDAPQTRVATDALFRSTWEDGDEIGVFAVKHALGTPATLAASGNFIHNVKLTYNSADGSWSGPAYWPNDGSVVNFYAYYPYDANATDPTDIAFNVAADQSGTTDDGKLQYNLSDLLTATSDNGGSGYEKGSTVTLAFSHALAMVQVTLTADRERNIGPVGNNISVVLRGVQTGAALDLADGVSASGNAGNVKMYRAGETDKGEPVFRALVPAQTPQDGYRFRLSQFNELYDYTPSTGQALTAAEAQIHPVKLPFIPTAKINKGTFLMGSSDGSNPNGTPGVDPNVTPAEPNRKSEETQHRVELTKDFYIGRYPITNAQFAAFLNVKGVIGELMNNPGRGEMTGGKGTWAPYEGQALIFDTSNFYATPQGYWSIKWNETNRKWEPSTDNGIDYSDHPVANVTWYGAKAFAEWIGGTLPTEAQWEYASRGGRENLPFGIGDGTKLVAGMASFHTTYAYDLAEGGQYKVTTGGTSIGRVTAVGSYPYANAYGLYDMHGNVCEWCADRYKSSYYTDPAAGVDPTGPVSGLKNVMRGGTYSSYGDGCRSAYRYNYQPDRSGKDLGIRVSFESN